MGEVKCEDVLGRDTFKSYSEFLLMLCIGQEYNRIGYTFDVSNMVVPPNLLGKPQVDFYKWLVYRNLIYAGSTLEKPPEKESEYYLDNEAISYGEGRLFEEKDDCYMWSNAFAKSQNYGKYKLTLYSVGDMNSILLHFAAHMLVSIWEKRVPKKKIVFYIDGLMGKATNTYVNLISCKKTLKWFDEMVDVQTDYSLKSADVEFSLFISNGVMAKRNKEWTVLEKLKLMELEGIKDGSICIMYERTGLAETNRVGRIVNSSIIRINKIDTKKMKLYITIIPLYRTKEEVRMDYAEIPEELQGMFSDMLEFNVKLFDKTLDLYTLGISNYLTDEEIFIECIDEYGDVDKYITVGKRILNTRLSQRDAIYWLLCQYDIEFDRELYKSMYLLEDSFLWDTYNKFVRGVLVDKVPYNNPGA